MSPLPIIAMPEFKFKRSTLSAHRSRTCFALPYSKFLAICLLRTRNKKKEKRAQQRESRMHFREWETRLGRHFLKLLEALMWVMQRCRSFFVNKVLIIVFFWRSPNLPTSTDCAKGRHLSRKPGSRKHMPRLSQFSWKQRVFNWTQSVRHYIPHIPYVLAQCRTLKPDLWRSQNFVTWTCPPNFPKQKSRNITDESFRAFEGEEKTMSKKITLISLFGTS